MGTAIPEIQDNWIRFDFANSQQFERTWPTCCIVGGRKVTGKNWRKILIALVERELADKNSALDMLYGKSLMTRTQRPFFVKDESLLRDYAQLSNGYWINIHYSIPGLIEIIQAFCLHCGYGREEIVLYGVPKTDSEVPVKIPSTVPREHSNATGQANTDDLSFFPFDKTVVSNLKHLLRIHYVNGYPLKSLVQWRRLQNFAKDDLNWNLELANDEFLCYLNECGMVFNGKVYVLSSELKEKLKELVSEYFADGGQAIFYETIYKRNEYWFSEQSIVSPEMLREVLKNLFRGSGIYFGRHYCGLAKSTLPDIIAREVLRVWGDTPLRSFKQLEDLLEYIPLERVKAALSQNPNFIRCSRGTYTHVGKVVISEKERERVRVATGVECANRGYVSIVELPLEEIADNNREISSSGLYDAVYLTCLADKYERKDKLISERGQPIEMRVLLRKYCCSLNQCQLDDLLQYQREIMGESDKRLAIEVANEVLVRISKESFITDNYVHFDITAIDKAIKQYVTDLYLPLKCFTIFSVFPDCGQKWTLFLLESYCRRFSKTFSFLAQNVNSRNVGVVVRKNCSLSYDEIMTDAVVRSCISLDEEADVTDFLFESGYVGRKCASSVEIIAKAKAIGKRPS